LSRLRSIPNVEKQEYLNGAGGYLTGTGAGGYLTGTGYEYGVNAAPANADNLPAFSLNRHRRTDMCLLTALTSGDAGLR
jgi:hypothetical protein